MRVRLRTWSRWRDIAGSGATTTTHTVTDLTNGTEYRFRVRAVNVSGEGAVTRPAVGATPKFVPPRPPPVAKTVSGTLPGALSVRRTGAASYELPIEVVPGTAGVEPSLSLVYHSNRGNGLLGVGWDAGGVVVDSPVCEDGVLPPV